VQIDNRTYRQGTVMRRFCENPTESSDVYPLSLHDALPIYAGDAALAEERARRDPRRAAKAEIAKVQHGQPVDLTRDGAFEVDDRSEEHTSELQSRFDLVCRLLLEKKKKP